MKFLYFVATLIYGFLVLLAVERWDTNSFLLMICLLLLGIYAQGAMKE